MQLTVAPKTIEIMLKTELTIQTKGLPSLQQITVIRMFFLIMKEQQFFQLVYNF